MKRWIVESWVNGKISDSWEFKNKEESLEFYERKKDNLNKERIEENRQSAIKFNNNDEWGYSWNDEEFEESEGVYKTWREAKKERLKNED